MNELIASSARDIVERLRRKEITSADLIGAATARIEEVDGAVNAVPTLCVERARKHATQTADGAEGSAAPNLCGIPILVKDLVDVAGVRTTYGSPIFKDHVPERSNFLVERLEENGAVVLGKSNTPEWGAGANTFNEVFGKTVNPWNTALTCGGSSGGSAVALATGMAWLATGSDLGGSLRIPAAFCSVVGLRPSSGRVPHGPLLEPFSPLWIDGPMARDVADLGLFFDAMCGLDPRDPLTFERPSERFFDAATTPSAPTRVAFSADLGITPVDGEVIGICSAAVQKFAKLGTDLGMVCPDFSAAHDAFQTLRAASFATNMDALLSQYRDQLKPEVIGNIELGLGLNAADIGKAERQRAALCAAMAVFYEDHDLLVTPCVAVSPFPVEQRYIEEINGKKLSNYIEWLSMTYAITLTGCPALSLPCGFTKSGLPVGLQLVGKPRGEAALLRHAAALEHELGLSNAPIDPKQG
jgi:amidase